MNPTITPGPAVLAAAVAEAAVIIRGDFTPAQTFQCREADTFARVFLSAGHEDAAATLVAVHRSADDDSCVHYTVPADPCLSPGTIDAATAYVRRLPADVNTTGDGGRYW